MGWDYFDLSSFLIAGLVLQLTVCVVAYVLIRHKVAKKEVFNLWVIALLVLHSFMVLVLSVDETRASSYRIGAEVYVCGRQVDLADVGSWRRALSKEGALIQDGFIYANSQGSSINAGKAMGLAGLEVSSGGVVVEVSRDFDLKAMSEGELNFLEEELMVEGGVDGTESRVSLDLDNGEVSCPDEESKGVWQAYVYNFDHENKTYSWRVLGSPSELSDELLKGSDGRRPADCVVLDYGEPKSFPDKDCLEVIKSDVELCVDRSSKQCEYRLKGEDTL